MLVRDTWRSGRYNKMPHTVVVIPNWNGRRWLPDCLAALSAQTWHDFRVLVVDNGSTDGSVEWLEEHAPAVQVIANSANRGFAAAINQGIRASDSRYVALLNNDTQAEPRWLETLIEVADSDPSVGLFACKMLFADAPDVINSAGLALDWAGFCWDWQGGQLDNVAEIETRECFGPCGGAALYRRVLFNDIGLFDEDFFAYAEDADVAWRAQRAGWRCLYVPAARVYHAASATAGEGSRFKRFMLSRNKVRLLAKNLPGGLYLSWWALVLLYDLLAAVYGLIARGDWAAIQGRWAGWMGLPRTLGKRRLARPASTAYLKLIQPLEWPWKISARFRHLQSPGRRG
jgi:GT2 family glycosyltransferase